MNLKTLFKKTEVLQIIDIGIKFIVFYQEKGFCMNKFERKLYSEMLFSKV